MSDTVKRRDPPILVSMLLSVQEWRQIIKALRGDTVAFPEIAQRVEEELVDRVKILTGP